MSWVLLGAAILAGMALPFQAGVNSILARHLGASSLAAFISFLAGTLALALFVTLTRTPLPSVAQAATAPWPVWIVGGVLGAYVVGSAIVVSPQIGVLSFFAGVITGQMVMSVVLDHFGALALPQHSFNVWRGLGICLLLGGMYLVRRF